MTSFYSLSSSKSFCLLPWVHMYYFTDGYVYPCPVVAGNPCMRYGKTTDAKEELWNSSVATDMRKSMLRGATIPTCEKECGNNISSCKKYFGNELLEANKNIIEGTDTTGKTEYNFVAWNVIESNLCNLKCKYCSFQYSNLWEPDKGVIFAMSTDAFDEVYMSSLDTVQEIWFAAGEPVLQSSTYDILNKLIDQNRLNVRIRFITNMMKISYKNHYVYDLLEQFSDVIVFGSWDMNGQIGEYIRKNSNETTIKNTIKIIKQKNIKFYLQSVMSIFNITTFPQFHYHLYEEGLLERDQVRYYNLRSPEKYRYSILPNPIKDKIKSNLLEYKQWIATKKELDTFANKESPLTTIDKIIETMYTGKWGHDGFSENENKRHYYNFLKERPSNNLLSFLKTSQIK